MSPQRDVKVPRESGDWFFFFILSDLQYPQKSVAGIAAFTICFLIDWNLHKILFCYLYPRSIGIDAFSEQHYLWHIISKDTYPNLT